MGLSLSAPGMAFSSSAARRRGLPAEHAAARARDQLETLLGAGEITKRDAQLCALVRKNELDAGMFYVLSRNMADAKEAEDEETLRILTHVHTRLQEELEEKKGVLWGGIS